MKFKRKQPDELVIKVVNGPNNSSLYVPPMFGGTTFSIGKLRTARLNFPYFAYKQCGRVIGEFNNLTSEKQQNRRVLLCEAFGVTDVPANYRIIGVELFNFPEHYSNIRALFKQATALGFPFGPLTNGYYHADAVLCKQIRALDDITEIWNKDKKFGFDYEYNKVMIL